MVSGLFALIGDDDLQKLLLWALNSMKHRVKTGYLFQSKVYKKIDDITPNIRKGVVAVGCLRSPRLFYRDILIHGTIYGPEDFDLSLELKKAADEPFLLASKLAGIDGAYTFVLPYDDGLVFARDPLGTKPLYIAQREGLIVMASEMKALTSIGLEKVERAEPGRIYYIKLDSQTSYKFKDWDELLKLEVSLDEASSSVLRLLEDSIKARVSRKKMVAVGFSGGLDSSLIAHLASKYTKVLLITVCTEGSRDLMEAEKAAELLDLPIVIKVVDEPLIREVLRELPRLIECKETMDLAIGLAVHLAAKAAEEEGCEDLFLGQLADELFCGYARYLRTFRSRGWDALRLETIQDVVNAYWTNFERDEKASSPFVELHLPFASLPLVDYALRLPVELKVDHRYRRKVVLREAALKAGVPERLALKEKKALQYSSGIQKAVRKVLAS